MKCPNCGAELAEGAKFCSNCGSKTESQTAYTAAPQTDNESQYEPIKGELPTQNFGGDKNEEKTYSNNTKGKFATWWKNLSLYSRVSAISIVIFTLMFLRALFAGRPFACIIAIISIALTVVALLMKKKVIKAPNEWLHIAALVLAFVLTVPYFGAARTKYKSPDSNANATVNSFVTESTNAESDKTEPLTDKPSSTVEPPTTEAPTTEATTEPTTEAPTTEKSLAKGEIELTNDSFNGNYKEVISELKEMGFTNVTKHPIYDCDSGFLDSLNIYSTEKVVIAGSEDYAVGDIFKKKDKVVVYYHAYVYDDPDIEYASVTVKKLDNDMEKNAINAEEKYEGKYFAVTGYIYKIDDKKILLAPDNSGWSLWVVSAEIKNDKQLDKAKKLSAGSKVTIKGKITNANSSFGSTYSMDIYKIVS